MNIDASTFSMTAFNTLVRSLLHRARPIEWIEWLPLAEVSVEMSERMLESFEALSEEDRYDFLNILGDENGGPLADTIMIILADHAIEISDEQLRLIVVERAEIAQTRHQERLTRLRKQADVLVDNIDSARNRLKEGFDLTEEIARLQRELAKLKSRECERNDLFGQVHQLEQEILRMETRKRILDSYDRVGRNDYLTQLTSEIDMLDSQKSMLESSIAETTAVRDQLRNKVTSKQQEIDDVDTAVKELSLRLEQLCTKISESRDSLQKNHEREQQLLAEHTELLSKVKRTEETNNKLEEKCKEQRAILAQLLEDARQAGMKELADDIDAVYKRLPEDESDRGFA